MKFFWKNIKKFLHCFLFVLLAISVLISLLKVWYIGAFLDSIIFDFICGSAKYLVYPYLLFIVVAFFLRNKWLYKKAISLRIIGMNLIILNVVLMIVSLVYYYKFMNSATELSTKQYFFNYFNASWTAVKDKPFLWESDPIQLTHPGFFWLLILVITKKSPIIFLWIVFILSFISLLIYVAYRTDSTLAKNFVKFGGKIKTYFQNKNVTSADDVNQNNDLSGSLSTSEIIKNVSKTDVIPFSLSVESNLRYRNYAIKDFSDISDDKSLVNEEHSQKYIDTIAGFFKKNKIDYTFAGCETGSSAIRIMFTILDKDKIQWITSGSIHKKLLEILNVKAFFIYVKDECLRIDLPLYEKGKISFKKNVDKLRKNNHGFSGLIGVDGKFDPIELNFSESPITLIYGDHQSGKQELILQLVLSLLVRYSPNDFVMLLIDNKNSPISRLEWAKNAVEYVANDINSGIEFIEKVIFEMKYRVKLLSDFKQSSINKYNEKTTKPIPHLLVIINDVNDFLAHDAQYVFNFLKLIRKYSQKLNVFCLITTNVITKLIASAEAKKIYKDVISLQTRTTEESELLLKNGILHKLFGDGDFYYIKNVEDPKIQRGQTTYVNNELMRQIISKVNNYTEFETLK